MSDRGVVHVTPKQLKELAFHFRRVAGDVLAPGQRQANAAWYAKQLEAVEKVRGFEGTTKERQALWADEVRWMSLELLAYREETEGKHRRLYKLVDRLLGLDPEYACFEAIPPNLGPPANYEVEGR